MEWQPIETAPDDGDMLVAKGDRIAVAFRDSGMSSYRFFSIASKTNPKNGYIYTGAALLRHTLEHPRN